jgi:hypothetical protein
MAAHDLGECPAEGLSQLRHSVKNFARAFFRNLGIAGFPVSEGPAYQVAAFSCRFNGAMFR